ncbi:MAG: phage tail tape measure protein [Anaerolineales bacterium]|nr:MAG: phage tail tape measure protein [Anaerolineales bacterium]
MTIGSLIVRVLMDASGYDKEADKVGKETQNLGKLFEKTSKAIGGAFVIAAKAATAAVVGLATASAVVGASFEKAISKVAAVKGIDKSSEAFKRLSDEARRLGATTLFSASQAAEGMEELARAGLTTDQIISASQKSLELAAGASISLADAASIVASTMAQFGLEAEQAGRITDVLTVATQGSLFAMGDLREAMKFAGTTGAAFGMTLEETTAAVAQFRDLGLEGSLAGTQFRMAMAAVAKPTAEAAKALDKYGITANQVNPELNSFRDIMLTIGEAGITATDAMEIFGKRAGANVAIVAKQMAEGSKSVTFDDLLTRLKDAEGTTSKTYEIMTDNVLGKFAELKSGAEELMISLFETYAGPLTDLLDAMVNLVRLTAAEVGMAAGEIGGSFEDAIGGFTDFINENAAKWARQFAEIVQAAADFASVMTSMIIPALRFILPLVDDIAILMATIWAAQKAAAFAAVITGTVIPAITTMTFSLTGMATALTAASGGLTAVAAALVVVVTGLALLISRSNEAKNAVEALRKEQERQAAIAQGQKSQRSDAIARDLLNTQERIVAERALLDLDTEAGKFRAIEIDQILKLDAATAALMFDRGELLNVNGDLVTVGSLLARGTDESTAAIQQAIRFTEEAVTATEKYRDAAESAAESDRLSKRLDELRKKLIALKLAGSRGVKTTQEQAVAAAEAAAALKRQIAALNGSGKATDEAKEASEELVRSYEEEIVSTSRLNMLINQRADALDRATAAADEAAAAAVAASRDGGTVKEAGAVFQEAGRVAGAMVAGVVGVVGAVAGAVGLLLNAGTFLTNMRENLDGAKAFLEALPETVTRALDAIVKALPGIIDALAEAIPKVVQALVDAIPGIIDAVVDGLPVLIEGLMEAQAVVLEALPGLITKVLEALPGIVDTFAEALPDVIEMFILALPPIYTALVTGLIKSVPKIVFSILKLMLIEIPIMLIKLIPKFALALGQGFIEGLKAVGEAIADFFKGIFSFFKKSEEEKAAKTGFLGIKKLFRKDDSAYSGISYVPRAMRVDVHQGEAIVPANRNAQSNGDTQSTAGFAAAHGGGGGGGGGNSVDVAVIVEGRILDAVQIVSEARGHAPQVAREMRRAGGVKIGLDRGKFSSFTR